MKLCKCDAYQGMATPYPSLDLRRCIVRKTGHQICKPPQERGGSDASPKLVLPCCATGDAAASVGEGGVTLIFSDTESRVRKGLNLEHGSAVSAMCCTFHR